MEISEIFYNIIVGMGALAALACACFVTVIIIIICSVIGQDVIEKFGGKKTYEPTFFNVLVGILTLLTIGIVLFVVGSIARGIL